MLVLKRVYEYKRVSHRGGNGGENVSIRHGWEQCFSRCWSWPSVGSLVLTCWGASFVS